MAHPAEAALALRHPATDVDSPPTAINNGRLAEGAVLEAHDLLDAPARYLEVFLIDRKHDRYYLTPTVKPE